MTVNEINRTIAKQCGWEEIPRNDGDWTAACQWRRREDGRFVEWQSGLKLYTEDLNAIYEAWMFCVEGDPSLEDEHDYVLGCVCCGLNPKQQHGEYAPCELEVAGINATARQRAEALLRVLELWKDD